MSSQSGFIHIQSGRQLETFCEQTGSASWVAFDTEFVGEDRYRPQLCLIQVATRNSLAVIDALSVADLAPFWELVSGPDRTVVVHAGREEYRFCLDQCKRPPTELFDIQVAAGLVGTEYPSAYSALVNRYLERSLPKHETRTDWRRRPLSSRQLEYAVQDVRYLPQLFDRVHEQLARLERQEWMKEEMQRKISTYGHREHDERWRRVSGITSLDSKSLAIVQQLWEWRESRAAQRDVPAKRVLRDDLIVELARRGTSDEKRIRSLRGMNFRHLQSQIGEIAGAIERGLAVPPEKRPRPSRRASAPEYTLLTQFLTTALSAICRDAQVASSLVGSASDIRQFVGQRLGHPGADEVPLLLSGWRAHIIGERLDQLLSGRARLSVADPRDKQPLRFEV